MRTYGRTTVGTVAYPLASDTKRVATFPVSEQVLLNKLSVVLDGGGGNGYQVVRGVVYDASGVLLAQGDEVRVAAAQPRGWVDLPFAAASGNLLISPGNVSFGVLAGGPNTNVVRVYGDGPRGMGGKTNADSYADGPSAAFGVATTLTSDLSIYMTGSRPFAALLPDESEYYYARLPWRQAQAVFGSTSGALPRTSRIVQLGWHDTFLDPEAGANVVIREDSALVSLLGERIRITTAGVSHFPRVAYAYVHDLAAVEAIDWEISATRRVFSQIGMLAATTISCVVDVVA